jgi:hypothetical protein
LPVGIGEAHVFSDVDFFSVAKTLDWVLRFESINKVIDRDCIEVPYFKHDFEIFLNFTSLIIMVVAGSCLKHV